MSKKKTEIGVGSLPTEEQKKGEVNKAYKKAESGEVEGHAYWERVICPTCDEVNRILADPNKVMLYECAYCGYTFTY